MSAPPTLTPLKPVVEALESASLLDAPGAAVGKVVRRVIRPGGVKDALSGTWLGHALHPLLTDVVIGSFVSATLLDLLGGDETGKAAERLIAVGIAAYGPTAVTGVNDWADTEIANPPVRRVGLVHAWSNAAALGLYSASLAARRKGARTRGKALATAGATVLGLGGYLGGHLAFTRGVGPNQTAFDPGPSEWTPAIGANDLTPGEPQRVVVDDTPVFLLRRDGALFALHDRCSHRGCSLKEGQVEGQSIVCICHGSRFSLRDGTVEHGPATEDQPAFDVREHEGMLELRRRPLTA